MAQGWKVKMANTLVTDHRIGWGEPGRHYKVGDLITEDDLCDTDRYSSRPNVWAWVWGGIVDPSGWDEYVVAKDLPATGHNGNNPHGYMHKGLTVTEGHFPAHVNFESLVEDGILKAKTTTSKKKGS